MKDQLPGMPGTDRKKLEEDERRQPPRKAVFAIAVHPLSLAVLGLIAVSYFVWRAW